MYFDDESWAVRYIIVDTGKWLPGRLVLISAMAVTQPDRVSRQLNVALTREQVRNSPAIDTEQPVSRQQERLHLRYYGYPYYWVGPALWGASTLPAVATPPVPVEAAGATDSDSAESHLRSCREVAGYHLRGTDGELGHADDFLVDDSDWAIRYLVVDTSNWWVGRKVLIAPEWVDSIDWLERSVHVDVTRATVEQAPRYDAAAHVTRQWEADYYAHHKRPPYWMSTEPARKIKTRRLRPPVITK